MRDEVLSSLASRVCAQIDSPDLSAVQGTAQAGTSLTCNTCRAGLNQMKSDIETLG